MNKDPFWLVMAILCLIAGLYLMLALPAFWKATALLFFGVAYEYYKMANMG